MLTCPPLHPWLKHIKPTQRTVGDANEAVIHFAGHIQSALQGSHLSGCRGTPWKWDIATLATAAIYWYQNPSTLVKTLQAVIVLYAAKDGTEKTVPPLHAIVDRHFPHPNCTNDVPLSHFWDKLMLQTQNKPLRMPLGNVQTRDLFFFHSSSGKLIFCAFLSPPSRALARHLWS